MKRTMTNIDEKAFDWSSDKIVVDTFTKKNLLELSRSHEKLRVIYSTLVDHDFMLYMHKRTESYFIKRNLVESIWQRTDLHKEGDTFYTVEPIAKEKANQLAPTRLLVIFSSIPSQDNLYSPNIAKRMLVENYPTISEHLVKNTLIVRIMDLNKSIGSCYLDTENYRNFQTDVQSIIVKVIKQYKVNKDDVILYGLSKGGTGALFHALLGDYHAVVVDPVLSLKPFNDDNDSLYLANSLPENLLPIFQKLINKNQLHYSKVILESPLFPQNYELFKYLKHRSLKMIDLFDSNNKVHEDVRRNSLVEQVTAINDMFIRSKNFRMMNAELAKLVQNI